MKEKEANSIKKKNRNKRIVRMDSFITILLQKIQQEYTRPFPEWKYRRGIPPEKWKWIQKECSASSDFDTLQLRKQLLKKEKENQGANTFYASCEYGSVSLLADHGISPKDVPWELWGRIFRLFYQRKPFTVYFLAHTSPRRFPSLSTHAIRPENINGGYTYPCRSDTIVIYRAEDATRVLIHELQHAMCLDDHTQGVDDIEAKTEAWAELIYTALLSKGKKTEWERMWSRQVAWIKEQNTKIHQHMRYPTDFPWRYTLGKEQILREWRLWKPQSAHFSGETLPTTSLRLTAPPTAKQKEEQNISQTSIIL